MALEGTRPDAPLTVAALRRLLASLQRKPSRGELACASAIALLVLLNVLGYAFTPVSFGGWDTVPLLQLLPFFALTAFVPTSLSPLIARFGSALTMILAVMVLTIGVCYFAIALSAPFPLADPAFTRWDAMLGFDWPSVVLWIDGYERLADFLLWTYTTFDKQLVLLPLLLCVLGCSERAFAGILAFVLIVLGAALLSIAFPAIGANRFHGMETFTHVNPHFGMIFGPHVEAVRAGPFELRMIESTGILAFPSVHAAGAVLCAWLAWGSLVLRVPLAALNAAMAASAIPMGAHYLVDVLAGIILAVVAIAVARRIVPIPSGTPERDALRAWRGRGASAA